MKKILNKIKKVIQINKYMVFKLPSSWEVPRLPDFNLLKCEEASPELIVMLFKDDSGRSKLFLKFVKSGMKGIIHYDVDKWVSYAWMSCPGTPGPSHLPFVNRLKVYWIHYCRTQEGFQNQGLYKRSLIKLCEMARKVDPFSEVYVDTKNDNLPSIRAIQKVGFKSDGFIETLRISIPRFSFVILKRWVKTDISKKESNNNE